MEQRSGYRTVPVDTDGMPPGIGNILVNEALERFAFYGMRAILITYMTSKMLLARDGTPAPMSNEGAKALMHAFVALTYAMPVVGAILSDLWLAKYRTIFWFSVVYCVGFALLVLDQTRLGLLAGLFLIALGSGIIKPCVSANVGDQFGRSNRHLLGRVYGWFYFAINLGAFASMFGTPVLFHHYTRTGSKVAFGLCLVFMVVATAVFWLGRHKYVHAPAGGAGFVRDLFGLEGLLVLLRLLPVYLLIAVFWSLFDQTMGAWILQAEHMDRHVIPAAWIERLPSWLAFLGYELTPEQISSVNSLMILAMIPLFGYVVYPLAGKFVRVTPLRKIGAGMFVAAASFVVSARIETWITAGQAPSLWWQILAYLLITAAEILVSITCLEFSYTQAPRRMKSLIMSYFLLSIALGNLFASGVNWWIENDDGTSKLPGASYYWFFVWAMLATAVVFIPVAMTYRGKTYTQDESQADESDAGPSTDETT